MDEINLTIFNDEIKKLKCSNLIKKNDKILLAFSGGPDSMFMYYVLNSFKEEYKLQLSLIYINHKLRDDVETDLKLVKEFAYKNKVDLYIEEIDVINYSKKEKKSIELSARELRYETINKILMEIGYDKIATGHNLDDNVETFFFRLVRGTSLKGLESIPEKRDNIIRPILNFKKIDILNTLKKANIKYVEDYTNFESDYTRNYIRNEIFPLIENINSTFKEKIVNVIEEIKNKSNNEHRQKLKELMEENGVNISKQKIDKIYKSLYNEDNSLKKEGTKKFDLGNDKILLKQYDNIKIVNKIVKNKKKELILSKNILQEWNDYFIGHYTNIEELKKNNGKQFVLFKINEKINKVKVRSRIDGDRINIKNLGYKKVKKIFIDEKISRYEREQEPIFLDFESGNLLLISNIKCEKNVKKVDFNAINDGDNIIIIGRKDE